MTRPTSALREHDPSCRELTELATELLDGALHDADRRALETHLASCDGCTAHLDQLRTAIELVRRAGVRPLDPVTRDRALATVRGASREHDPTAG